MQCPEGSQLIAGGCSSIDGSDGSLELGSNSSLATDPNIWTCSWQNVASDRDRSAKTVAVCLNPALDAITGEIVSEAIEYHPTSEPLPANSMYIVESTCAPGDILLAGGCRMENTQDSTTGIKLVRFGMHEPIDNRPNTWQCAWRNTTASTPTAIAMAICLKPTAPAAPADL